jgi:DNA-binding LacI/PurR family transcriptional regulator
LAASIRDVALKAGVSTATVSHVLNGTRPASQETRDRVMAAIKELGYAQNQAARDLARGRSSFLGMIVSDVRNPFFPEIISAFQDQALAHDMDALVLNTNYDPDQTLKSVQRLIGLQVPGVAILTSQIDPGIADILKERNIAAVYLDLGRVGPLISNLILEYENGISEAVEYLADLGHRRIAYLGGPPHLPSSERRKRAFVDAMIRLGLRLDQVVDGDFTVKGSYQAACKILSSNAPTAIVAGNDLTAIGIMHCAYDRGLNVPEQLSVVGFDDIFLAEYTQPALTTVSVPRSEIGRIAFEALWAMISKPSEGGFESRINTRLIRRQSAAAPCN